MLTALEMPRITLQPTVSNEFMLPKDKVYDLQYASLYFTRLVHFRQRLESNEALHVERVLDVLPGQRAFILGTVYVDAPLKPNVLDSVTRNVWESAPPPREKYFTRDDVVYLEDESGRVKLLIGSIHAKHLFFVTGTVLGFVGVETADGDFKVEEIIYPSYTPRVNPSILDQQDSWIALVSGLHFGISPVDLSVELLVDFLTADKSIADVFSHFNENRRMFQSLN
jgi:DNA polymerase delta subunit 2